uniref:Probable membrane transporter protein n=1 Tax=Candidatus Kentrum sp. SD TaxID=2126332 RepID=A0A451BPP7_9GAMM|nr:MAG: hypothetical protein BECKSD772F_GA0070984_10924 [Candidatus Kentron sp. SD]VFK47238.1 MAG: hypothetical protein BECKSD772E_GA0070983_10904 [Candidatus Kentron sp. SD]VFK80244.1 MAG: hypothetical protein BECKSD772D_GA0070982_10964 [Candidatus Kentron sp. SD]
MSTLAESAYLLYPLAIGAAILAGFINTLAGSGSLITLPVLIFLGLPPGVANGTNRIGILIQSIVGVMRFRQSGKLEWHDGKFFVLPSTLGAIAGAFIAIGLDAEKMNMAIAAVMGVMLLLTIAQPEKWLRKKTELAAGYRSAGNFLIFFLIGVHGGFIQAGVGILMLIAMVLRCGFAVANANAVKLVLVLIFTVPAVAIFVIHDQVHWPLALIMAGGQGAGAWLAAHFASNSKNAALWTQRLLIVIIIASMGKLLTM